ncbi:MAG: OmpA family protein [Myxococcales bacterium]|nr:MAG: OmpA family protein [Myxococcales bacterium]
MKQSDDLRMFNRGWAAALLAMVMSVLGAASSAEAQGSTHIDLNQYRPAELATDGFATSTADGQGHKRFGFMVYMDYNDDALVFQQAGTSTTASVVHRQLTGHLAWNLGFWDHLVIFMDIPYHFIIDAGQGVQNGLPGGPTGMFGYLLPNGGHLGDIYFGARGNILGTRADVFQLGLQATMTINTASLTDSLQKYAGQADKSPYLGGWFELLMTFNAGDVVRIPIQAGYKLGTQAQAVTPGLFVGNEFTFGGGLLFMIADDQFMISAESFGRTAANSTVGFWRRETTPVEVLGGFKYLHPKGFVIGVSGSAGVASGYGAPDWRGVGMIGFTMPEPEPIGDADGDGILDDVDECPNEAEDFDGFQDEDGCPDLDNDGDGVLDVNDGCPNDPEDIDGFEDEDGCPDPDNDGDGILDVDDQCPNEPGPPENNGCPDPDRDGDGVPDRIDNCPDEPGTVENQGCQEAQLVVIGAAQLEILEKVYFKTGSHKLQKRSFALLDNVAKVMNAHPEIELIRVEGHSDATGSLKFNMRLSKRRADTVVRYLVGRGKVSKERLISEGFGPTRPLVPDAKTKEELAQNRRVEFHIVDTEPEESEAEPEAETEGGEAPAPEGGEAAE